MDAPRDWRRKPMEREPLLAIWGRIATPVCGLARNDRLFGSLRILYAIFPAKTIKTHAQAASFLIYYDINVVRQQCFGFPDPFKLLYGELPVIRRSLGSKGIGQIQVVRVVAHHHDIVRVVGNGHKGDDRHAGTQPLPPCPFSLRPLLYHIAVFSSTQATAAHLPRRFFACFF